MNRAFGGAFYLLQGLLVGAMSIFMFYLGGEHQWWVLLCSAALHAVATACFTCAAIQLIPEHYSEIYWKAFLVFFCLMLALPGIGPIGVFAGLVPALRWPREQEPEFTVHTKIPDLPFKPVNVDLESVFTQGGLYQALKHSDDADRRLKAVLTTQRMNERMAIPILQIALKDPVDDVRLLAYSILDQKETDINLEIKESLTELENAKKSDKPSLHNSLAHLYWELVYLGLAQGDVLKHVLKTSKQHAEAALEAKPHAGLQFLLGRILLREEHYSEAETAFKNAREQGIAETIILPYLAELAYLQRDFQQIPALLGKLPATDQKRKPINSAVRYWEAA